MKLRSGLVLLGLCSSALAFGSSGSGFTSIPCLKLKDGSTDLSSLDSFTIANVTDPTQVCKAMLPKCSDVYEDIRKKVTSQLTQKIWGYYNGVDANAQSTGNNFGSSPKLPYTVCSVVGQDLVSGIAEAGTEGVQSIGLLAKCGTNPLPQAGSKKKSLHLKFTAKDGTLWYSYVLGIKPWLYRRSVYEIFGTQSDFQDVLNHPVHGLMSDLSNVSAVLSQSKSGQTDLQATLNQIGNFYTGLSASAKKMCEQSPKGLADACSQNITAGTSVQTLCTMYQSQQAIQGGAYSNLFLAEVYARANQIYSTRYAHLVDGTDPDYKLWSGQCDSNILGRGKAKQLACVASCLLSGEYSAVGRDVHPGSSGHSCHLTKTLNLSLDDYSLQECYHNHSCTRQAGFAGYAEKLIRTQICGQTDGAKPGPYCSTHPYVPATASTAATGDPYGVASKPN